MAYLWLAQDDAEGAAAAVSVAARVRDPDRAPLSIDYLERALGHGLETAKRSLESGEEGKGRLIV